MSRSSLRSFSTTLVAAAAILSIACAPASQTTPSQPPPDDEAAEAPAATSAREAPIDLPTAILPDGTRITIEVAVTPEELSQGLMFRPALAEDRGMLLLFEDQRFPHIWMKNVWIPLDVVYLDDHGGVVEVVENAPPCKAEPCPHYIPKDPARAVLELAAHVAARHDVVSGSTVSFSGVSGYPADG